MWRRYGDALYAILMLVVFTVETVGLALLMWGFFFHRLGFGPRTVGLHFALALAVGVTALAVLVVTGYTLAYQAISTARSRSHREAVIEWGRRWVDVLYRAHVAPQAPLPRPAIEALIDLREELEGEYGDRVTNLLLNHGVIEDLLDEANRRRPGRGGLAGRLEALDLLARARAPRGFDTLARLTRDPEVAVRVMAVRALTRATARLTDEDARDEAAAMLVGVFAQSDIPPGAVEEALLVLGDAAPNVLRRLLADWSQAALIPIALDAIGRLKLVELLDIVAVGLERDEPDVRAAALRAIALIGFVPPDASTAVMAACRAPEAAVRTQAARAAALLPADQALAALKPMMSDASWWVRRSAAWSLARIGSRGISALRRVSRTSSDRFARHIAVQVLVDSERLNVRAGLLLNGV